MQRATDREINAARRVAEAVVEFLIASDEGWQLRAPKPTTPQVEVKLADFPVAPAPRPEPAKESKPLLVNPGQLISVDRVAELLECSPRTVYRLADCGRLPRPRKVGSLVRWSVGEISGWVEEGCPKQYRGR
jgi:excisionase family DNA binding protein